MAINGVGEGNGVNGLVGNHPVGSTAQLRDPLAADPNQEDPGQALERAGGQHTQALVLLRPGAAPIEAPLGTAEKVAFVVVAGANFGFGPAGFGDARGRNSRLNSSGGRARDDGNSGGFNPAKLTEAAYRDLAPIAHPVVVEVGALANLILPAVLEKLTTRELIKQAANTVGYLLTGQVKAPALPQKITVLSSEQATANEQQRNVVLSDGHFPPQNLGDLWEKIADSDFADQRLIVLAPTLTQYRAALWIERARELGRDQQVTSLPLSEEASQVGYAQMLNSLLWTTQIAQNNGVDQITFIDPFSGKVLLDSQTTPALMKNLAVAWQALTAPRQLDPAAQAALLDKDGVLDKAILEITRKEADRDGTHFLEVKRFHGTLPERFAHDAEVDPELVALLNRSNLPPAQVMKVPGTSDDSNLQQLKLLTVDGVKAQRAALIPMDSPPQSTAGAAAIIPTTPPALAIAPAAAAVSAAPESTPPPQLSEEQALQEARYAWQDQRIEERLPKLSAGTQPLIGDDTATLTIVIGSPRYFLGSRPAVGTAPIANPIQTRGAVTIDVDKETEAVPLVDRLSGVAEDTFRKDMRSVGLNLAVALQADKREVVLLTQQLQPGELQKSCQMIAKSPSARMVVVVVAEPHYHGNLREALRYRDACLKEDRSEPPVLTLNRSGDPAELPRLVAVMEAVSVGVASNPTLLQNLALVDPYGNHLATPEQVKVLLTQPDQRQEILGKILQAPPSLAMQGPVAGQLNSVETLLKARLGVDTATAAVTTMRNMILGEPGNIEIAVGRNTIRYGR